MRGERIQERGEDRGERRGERREERREERRGERRGEKREERGEKRREERGERRGERRGEEREDKTEQRRDERREGREDDPGPKFPDWFRAWGVCMLCTRHVSAFEFVAPIRFLLLVAVTLAMRDRVCRARFQSARFRAKQKGTQASKRFAEAASAAALGSSARSRVRLQ